MVRFLGASRPGALAAVLIVFVAGCAGCGTGHGHGAAASRSPRGTPGPSATGYVKQASFLTGVACQPTGTCAAVGWYYHGSAGPSLALAARWNGRAWLAQPAPSRGRDSSLAGVSCAGPSFCLAVGTPAEAWTGTRWAVIPGLPAGPLSSVSCPAPGSCQAVGPLPAESRLVAARWDGHTWHTEHMPRPAPAAQNLALAAVSCATASFCMAAGNASRGATARPSPSYRVSTLAEVWDGTRWRIVPTPGPSRVSTLSGVSCPSPVACVAVGSTAGGARTLAERWNGVRWAVQRTPDIGHIGYSALTAVSCASAADCTAVGSYNDGAFGIAEHWDGSRWSLRRLPVPPGPPGEAPHVLPVSVSCTPATCMVVGTSQNRTLAERWDGSRWIIEPTPNPA